MPWPAAMAAGSPARLSAGASGAMAAGDWPGAAGAPGAGAAAGVCDGRMAAASCISASYISRELGPGPNR